MKLPVITNDGRQGLVTGELLKANAFRPVTVQFPDGDSKPYYLRELKIDDHRRERRTTRTKG